MDRKGRQLIAALLAVCGLVAAAFAQSPLDIREASWLAPDGLFEALSSEPAMDRAAMHRAAFVRQSANSDAAQGALRADLVTGEMLFRAPLLLGGQAAKAGLSCQSCHVNGRGNPHFQFAAISGEPGTADTTHSFFSKTLGNQVFDPVPIPDLTQPGKVDHDPKSGALEAFITNIVVEEFSGSGEMSEVIGPLAAYVRALQLSQVPADVERRPRSLSTDLANLSLTAEQARKRWDAGKRRVAALLLSSAQSQLKGIHERMMPGDHDSQRAWLVARSREAGALRRALDAGEDVAPLAIKEWSAALQSYRGFADVEPHTLYNPDILARALGR